MVSDVPFACGCDSGGQSREVVPASRLTEAEQRIEAVKTLAEKAIKAAERRIEEYRDALKRIAGATQTDPLTAAWIIEVADAALGSTEEQEAEDG